MINDSLSNTSINILGSTLYTLANLGDYSSVIQLSLGGSEDLIEGYMVSFRENQFNLVQLRSNFTGNSQNWQSCNSYQNLFENVIPVFDKVNGTNVVVYMSILNFIDFIIETVIFM